MDRRHAIVYGASGLALLALVVVYRRRQAAAAAADQAAAYGPVVVPSGVGLGGSGAGDGTAPLGGNTYNFTFGVPAPVTTTPGSGATGAANGEPCSSSGDCKAGLTCCNKSCQPQGLKCKPLSSGGCTLSTDCPPGQKCVNKACVAKNKGGGKTDCPAGQVYSKTLKRCVIPVDQGVGGPAQLPPHTVGALRSSPAASGPALPPQPGVSTLGQTYRSGLAFPSAHPVPLVRV